uniref:Uncharacterized protein LOC105120731 n=1 Tax=Rhizophora mucronata TaxID=61149 RepID=A0A2P2IHI0_RHIMU
MQSPCLHLCKTFTTNPSLRFHETLLQSSSFAAESLSLLSNFTKFNKKRLVTRCHNRPQAHRHDGQSRSTKGLKAKGKNDNVWSVDNDMAKATAERENERERARQRRRRGRKMGRGKRNKAGRIIISGAMLMEVETVLQTQEPVIRPAWNTFASSVSGIWKGVGAVFSPITAEMEPIEIGSQNENLYDCYTLSRIEAMTPSYGGQGSVIKRKRNWVTLNPYGEVPQNMGGNKRSKGEHKDGRSSLATESTIDDVNGNVLPNFESFDFGRSDLMEEDVMGNESGLVFFEVWFIQNTMS